MVNNIKLRHLLVLTLAVSALPFGLWASHIFSPGVHSTNSLTVSPFSWTNTDGELVELSSVKSPLVMLFVGYLSCDSVCPARLGELVTISRSIPSQELTLLFITLDPNRDTLERRKELVASLGISAGAMDDKALSRLRFELNDRQGDISLHSANVYVLSPAGKLITVFGNQSLSVDTVKSRLSKLNV
ncbi:SCO family protein [Gilvimarinus polysaccharolyticus]|uniref:SCO family protein n=1 Tax=Gilvimarinus polysaccharolyticus TaxID=863921 RepID=UPI0006735CB8|nr:SCO family protein [Gilvimarinus polysaccharolyticus]